MVWFKYLSFFECALNSTVATSTRKAPFELVFGENVMVLLDHLTSTTQFSHVQAAGEIAEEVSQLVDIVKTEFETD